MQEFQRLNNAQASKALPVELEGVVTYSDPDWGLFFFHDRTGSFFINVQGSKIKFPFATRVRVTGVASPGETVPVLVQPKIQVLGRGVPPVPERRSVAELNAQVGDSQYVVTEGVLQACDMNWDRVCFRILDGKAMAWVVLAQEKSLTAQRLAGAKVRVKGVCGGHEDSTGKRIGAQIFVNKLEDIEVEESAPQAAQLRPNPNALRTVKQVQTLSMEQARKARPVQLLATVTYSDPEWGLLFVRDDTGSIYVNVHGASTVYPLGTRVRVDAVTGAGDVGPIMEQATIQVLQRGPPPTPDPKTIAQLNAGVADSTWVSTEGVLRPCDKILPRICFRIVDGKSLAWVIVPHPDSPAAQRLIGSTVRIRGASGLHLDDANKPAGAQVFVNSLDGINVESPGFEDPFSPPPTPMGSLGSADADRRFVHLAHVRGSVTWESAGRFILQDNSGGLSVTTRTTIPLHTGNVVDVAGFPGHGELSPVMFSDATVRLAAMQPKDSVAPLEVNAAEIVKRSLSARRVRLTAHLISQSASATEYVYQLEDGKQRFSAKLLRNDAAREIVGLPGDATLRLTGVAVIRNGTPEWPESLQLLVESPADMEVLEQTGWFTFKHVLSVLGAMGAFVIGAVIWVTQLRRTVRKQTNIIRARLERELQLETRYQRLFERNLAAVFRWRPDGSIVDFNMAFVQLLGFQSSEELLNRSYWDFEADPEQREELRQTLQTEALSNRETTLRRDDGVAVYLLMNITPVRTPEGMVYETTAIDVTELRDNQAELQKARDAAFHESLNDPLTGLPNRRLMTIRLAAILAKARSEDGLVGLLYLDLDGFKVVNDSFSHAIGDALLVQVSVCLRSQVRQQDVVARLGSDEFVVILDNLRTREEAALVANSLLLSVSNPFRVAGHELSISASIGISIFPETANDAEGLMNQADSAVYAAKREGKNRLVYFTPELGVLVHERMTLENQLRGAMQRDEIFLHYQPEFDLATNRLLRFEALARWTHPALGMIPPDKFIPVAEESGLIVSLGAFIMRLACLEAVKWQAIAGRPVQVAVNVSSIQFRRKGFVEEVSYILDQTGLRPELLQIELTESAMMSGAEHSAGIMNRLRALGISLAIDDFGTGYSCLSYLPTLPFDALKIDRSFVAGLGTQPESEALVRTLVSLAHNMGMRVIIEGVETAKQLELIRNIGANEVQGYLLGRPTATPVETFLLPAGHVSSDEFAQTA